MRPVICFLLFFLFSFSTFSQTLDSKEKEEVQKEYTILDPEPEPLLWAKKGATILDEPSETGNILLKLEEAAPIVQIVNITEKYFQICFVNKCGYISSQDLGINPQSEASKEGRKKRLLEIELKPAYKDTGKGSGYSSL